MKELIQMKEINGNGRGVRVTPTRPINPSPLLNVPPYLSEFSNFKIGSDQNRKPKTQKHSRSKASSAGKDFPIINIMLTNLTSYFA